jgi:hypothetical protein
VTAPTHWWNNDTGLIATGSKNWDYGIYLSFEYFRGSDDHFAAKMELSIAFKGQ